jgi:hypothetical protein
MSLGLIQYSDLTLILARRREMGFGFSSLAYAGSLAYPWIYQRDPYLGQDLTTCQQKPYPSGDPVPLRLSQRTRKYFSLKQGILYL